MCMRSGCHKTRPVWKLVTRGRWDPATHPEWSSIPIGVRTVPARVWTCMQWPFWRLRGVCRQPACPAGYRN